nr:MAG TPA: hypothetical protein [Caudoviricetes sp.]
MKICRWQKDGHAFNLSRRVTECNYECCRYMVE